MKQIKRAALAEVLSASAEFPALIVTGARQVGKTTLLKEAAESGRRFVSLDELTIRDLARRDPQAFLSAYPPPVVIDEIQYAPQLLPTIKAMIDQSGGQNGMFWLSGSQQFHLMRDISESLAGRVAVLKLGGISQGEELGRSDDGVFSPSAPMPASGRFDGMAELFARIHRGGYPALVSGKVKNLERFFGSYVGTYVERDVRDLAKVSDEERFLKFIRAVAARTGQLLNLSDLSRDVGITVPTAKDWLGILKASNLVYLLQPYSRNVTSRIVKTPKLYFTDTGLCCYLLGWDSPKTLMNGAMAGAMLETFVVGELLKRYWNCGKEPRLYFYRDRVGVEIDILIERNGVLEPVEVKRNTNPGLSDIKSFKKVAGLGFPMSRGAVVCPTELPLPLTSDVSVIPAAAI